MKPRLLRPVEPPLGAYLRPGRNDHQVLLGLLAEGALPCSGLVMDATLTERHADLRREVVAADAEAVLDPRSADLASPSGMARSGVAELPWAGQTIHSRDLLAGSSGDVLVDQIADHVARHDFNAVLAPTHIVEDAGDPWLRIDGDLTRKLRVALDSRSRRAVPIYYPLSITTRLLRDPEARSALAGRLRHLPLDAVWLRVSPFGASSGPLSLKHYIEACAALRKVSVPLVAEHSGSAGVALLAFGAVGGIESGVTLGESFDARPLLKAPSAGTPFSPPPRVYIKELGSFLSRKDAASFFENRQMKALFGCKNESCCRRGFQDMLIDPRRHFVLTRSSEVGRISRVPSTVRPQVYLDEFLRPATDLAIRAAQVAPSLQTQQRRLESWRVALGALVRDGYIPPAVQVPEGRRYEQRLGA
jgi:hypothetical protein